MEDFSNNDTNNEEKDQSSLWTKLSPVSRMHHEKDIPPAERQPERNFTEETIFEDTLFKNLKESNYAVLADLMGANRELAIFRKFDALNMLVLLSLQAELLELAQNVENGISADESSYNSDRQAISRSFLRMWSRPEGHKQWKTILKLREKLHEYSLNIQAPVIAYG